MAESDEDSGRGRRRGELSPGRGRGLLIGRLKEHGAANYQFRAKEDPSYYVTLLTSRGDRTIWGRDLERAIKEGDTQPKAGDLVGARRISREAVTITTRERDAEGRVVAQQEHHAHRTRWEVEKIKFFGDRARLARRLRDEQADVRESLKSHPELRSTFLTVRAAEEFATHRIADPKDRERFLELVKNAMTRSIRKGEPLPSVSLRQTKGRLESQVSKQDTGATPPPSRKPEDPTR